MAVTRSLVACVGLGLLPLSLALAEAGAPVQLQVQLNPVDQKQAKQLARQFRSAVQAPLRDGQLARVALRHRPLPEPVMVEQPTAAPGVQRADVQPQTSSPSERQPKAQIERRAQRQTRVRPRQTTQEIDPRGTPAQAGQRQPDVDQRLLQDASRLMKRTTRGQSGRPGGANASPRQQEAGKTRLHALPPSKGASKKGSGSRHEEGPGMGQGKGPHQGFGGRSGPGTGFGSGGGKGRAGSGGPRR